MRHESYNKPDQHINNNNIYFTSTMSRSLEGIASLAKEVIRARAVSALTQRLHIACAKAVPDSTGKLGYRKKKRNEASSN